MQKMIVFLVIFLSIALSNLQTVSADIGPKASAEVHIIGVEGDYYFELLILYRGQVSNEVPDYFDDILRYEYYRESYPERLVSYQDDEGFAACTLYYGPPCYYRQLDEHRYKMTYFSAPRVFKVAIVTEDDVLIVSESIERRMFEARFIFDVRGVDLTEDQFGVGQLTEELPVSQAISGFFLRLILTIGIELGILALFMYRKKASYQLVGLVNLISQTLLSLGVMVGYYFGSMFGAIAIILIGEVLVFSFEIVIYAHRLKEKSLRRAIVYGFIANTVTFITTFLLLALESGFS